jgi:hypothetical protein
VLPATLRVTGSQGGLGDDGAVHLTRLSVGLFLLSGLLLLTYGGAIFAAPLTLPLMY